MYQKFLSEEGSAYREQLNKGFSILRFDQLLEQEFRTTVAASRMSQLKLSMVLLLAAGVLFLALDLYGEFTTFGRGRQSAGSLTLSVTSTFFVYFCFGLRFWQAVGVSSLLCIGHVVMLLVRQGGLDETSVWSILLLLMPNGVAALVAYQIEYHERQRYLMEWELKFQANHDQLTGLWNRRALHDHFARAWAHCNRERQRLSVALIDIDYFKNYNDTYGHIKGDQCLAEIGRLLLSIGQRPLDLVARYGGEEFAVLLPNCGAQQAERIMQQLRQLLADRRIPHVGSKAASYVTVSVGVVSMEPRQSMVEFNKLMSCADKALYAAKSRGRNTVVMYNQLEPAANDHGGPVLARTIPFSRTAGTK